MAASASVFDEEKEASLSVGCDSFIAKPVRAHELFEVMAELLPLTWAYSEGAKKRQPTAAGDDNRQSQQPKAKSESLPLVTPPPKRPRSVSRRLGDSS